MKNEIRNMRRQLKELYEVKNRYLSEVEMELFNSIKKRLMTKKQN